MKRLLLLVACLILAACAARPPLPEQLPWPSQEVAEVR